MLPAKTRRAISRTHPVRCYKGDANGAQRQIRGRKCPNRPTRGVYGWEFSPPKGSWDVPSRHLGSGHRLATFLQATQGSGRHAKRLSDRSGQESERLAHWSLWDAPVGGETCPTADGHGPYQGIFVARRR